MSKRIVRINRKDLGEQLAGITGRDINVVLNDDHTKFGVLHELLQDTLILRDHRDHLHTIDFTSVAEVIYDEVSAW